MRRNQFRIRFRADNTHRGGRHLVEGEIIAKSAKAALPAVRHATRQSRGSLAPTEPHTYVANFRVVRETGSTKKLRCIMFNV